MKSPILAASLGVVAMSLAATASFAADADRSPALLRLHEMLERMDSARPQSRARLALRDLVRDMAEDGIDSEDFIDRDNPAGFKFCMNRHEANRDRMEPPLDECLVNRLEPQGPAKATQRATATTVHRTGSNTVYRRTVGKGHKLVTKQSGAGNRIAIVQSD